MYLVTKRKIVMIGLAFVISCITIFFVLEHYNDSQELYFINWTLTDTISCHYLTEGDVLPSAEDITPTPDSIFFHETSCRGGLNSRQACAIESAARIHPARTVYVLFSSPITNFVLKRSCLKILKQFKNVKLARLHIVEYAKGTPLGELLANHGNNESSWRIEHTADMLRYTTLYKYGGVYLDTDMLVVKSLDPLGKNWAAREDGSQVNVAAVAIDRDDFGHSFVEAILNDIKSDFRPNEWVYNGPGAMTRVLLTFCNTTTVTQLSTDICHGFRVYKPNLIYPIHYQYVDTYFNPGELPISAKDAYTHHLWNRLSHDQQVQKDSPYDKLAKKYCPTIRHLFDDNFGL